MTNRNFLILSLFFNAKYLVQKYVGLKWKKKKKKKNRSRDLVEKYLTRKLKRVQNESEEKSDTDTT